MNQSESTGPRRLYRSQKDKVIGGVCGGLGSYLNVDPVVIRVIWLALVFFGGTGFLAYLLAWILIPQAPEGEEPGVVERKTDGTKIIGIILIGVALLWLAGSFGLFYVGHFPWEWLAPLALVALGAALLLRPRMQEASEKSAGTYHSTTQADVKPASPSAGGEGVKVNPEADPTDVDTEQPKSGETNPPATLPESEGGTKSGDDKPNRGDAGAESSGEEDETKRPFDRWPLRRTRDDRVLGGVCGGIAKYFKVDATLIRVGWAFLTLASMGLGVFAYLALFLVIPEEEA